MEGLFHSGDLSHLQGVSRARDCREYRFQAGDASPVCNHDLRRTRVLATKQEHKHGDEHWVSPATSHMATSLQDILLGA